MPGYSGFRTQLWTRGEKVAMAKAAGITRQHLCELLSRRCRVRNEAQAERLAAAALSIGVHITKVDWLCNMSTSNPFFAPLKQAA